MSLWIAAGGAKEQRRGMGLAVATFIFSVAMLHVGDAAGASGAAAEDTSCKTGQRQHLQGECALGDCFVDDCR